MVRTRGRDGSIVRRNQRRRGVPTSLHGELAIDLGRIPYSGLSPSSDGNSHGSHSSTPSSSFPSSSTHSSNPSSSIPSSSHHAFTFSPPPSTLSPYHPYVPSPPHPSVSDPLIHTLSPYVPAHPVSCWYSPPHCCSTRPLVLWSLCLPQFHGLTPSEFHFTTPAHYCSILPFFCSSLCAPHLTSLSAGIR